ncbi:hypothetical protein CRG98_006605 [Punica granatum]|uniref:Uncharacterized protein n=1 Tax=Punica granatum TaxID=22663 RepID=A0A2I0KX09_PUNGR|nr:hypothetical protein CRG98_006605 [Punica granatum]
MPSGHHRNIIFWQCCGQRTFSLCIRVGGHRGDTRGRCLRGLGFKISRGSGRVFIFSVLDHKPWPVSLVIRGSGRDIRWVSRSRRNGRGGSEGGASRDSMADDATMKAKLIYPFRLQFCSESLIQIVVGRGRVISTCTYSRAYLPLIPSSGRQTQMATAEKVAFEGRKHGSHSRMRALPQRALPDSPLSILPKLPSSSNLVSSHSSHTHTDTVGLLSSSRPPSDVSCPSQRPPPGLPTIRCPHSPGPSQPLHCLSLYRDSTRSHNPNAVMSLLRLHLGSSMNTSCFSTSSHPRSNLI